jgi:hypothetical protein
LASWSELGYWPEHAAFRARLPTSNIDSCTRLFAALDLDLGEPALETFLTNMKPTIRITRILSELRLIQIEMAIGARFHASNNAITRSAVQADSL